MAYHQLSTNVDKYSLFLDNRSAEDALGDDDVSTASNFDVVLDPRLDLSSLLYLKAVEAELGVVSLIIDSLPLCFTRNESIEIQFTIPESTAEANFVFNRTSLRQFNILPLQLAVSDFCCSEPQLALDYLNGILHYTVNHFVLYRYLVGCLDCNIFKEDFMHVLSASDVMLIKHYMNIAVLCRLRIHSIFCSKLGIVNDDISELAVIEEVSDDIKHAFTEGFEEGVIEESACLRPVAARLQPRGGRNIEFANFRGLDLTKPSIALKAAFLAVETETLRWLAELDLLLTVSPDSDVLTTDCLKELKKLYISNRQLFMQILKSREILTLQTDRNNKRRKPEADLFHSNVLQFSLDQSGLKCRFHFKPGKFLTDDGSSITIRFPPQISYVLGSRSDEGITVGPLTAATASTGSPRLSSTNILHSNQMLPSSICTIPKILFVATDVITSQSRDMWLRSTPFSDYHLIFNLNVDDQVISSRMITKPSDDPIFYRIQKVNNILEKFSMKVLDHNLRQCIFAQRTYTRIALVIKPVALESY